MSYKTIFAFGKTLGSLNSPLGKSKRRVGVDATVHPQPPQGGTITLTRNPKWIPFRKFIYAAGFILLSLFLSCGEPAPPNLVSQDKMVVLLREFHLAQSIVEAEGIQLDMRTAKNQEVYDLILDHYGQEKETFYESYQYYLANPALMDSIYTEIIDQYNHKLPVEQEKKFNKGKLKPGEQIPDMLKNESKKPRKSKKRVSKKKDT